ncbi:hypothetical protein M406DRAFT_287461 [Cryphonectria parasitica EP155]|uniref:Flavin-nucleotide-binding protein n=1 Tax=Cryphonectria parasitica (strain ATCC 38755 / EP155) TaxID=660469 RepID=A0A9P5CTE6_CRYP1|nr:uncharacterized protein M406DRAFT_287461 [Cryphonectria parasitica EP155]KAF3769326.1 hypothetical protein M406DRAFT_287461 [Cryphonectria parasitica EP155]
MASEDQHQVSLKTAQSAINRHKERGHYDVETVHSIFNSTAVAHVSFVPDPSNPLPVVLPMIARIGTFPGGDGEAAAYIHGYVSSRMFRPQTGRSEPATREEDAGFPVCIAATKIDNLVLALTPFNHSYDYRSAVVHGTATLLDPGTRDNPLNRDELLWAMKLITDVVCPGRYDNTRVPPDEAEIASTRILKVRINSASAKIRDSGVKEDAKDLKNEAAVNKVWTGVIPYVETLGVPTPAETNKVAAVPAYILDHVKEHNEKAQAGRSGGLVSKVMSSLFGS